MEKVFIHYYDMIKEELGNKLVENLSPLFKVLKFYGIYRVINEYMDN